MASQAEVVAHNILADIRGRDRKPYRYTNTAEAVSLGSSNVAVRFYGLWLYGLLARLIWLLGYSFLVTGDPNRVRIIMDWLLSVVFGRDITFIKLKKKTVYIRLVFTAMPPRQRRLVC